MKVYYYICNFFFFYFMYEENTFSPSTAFLNDNNINIEIEYSNNVNKNNFFEILKEQSQEKKNNELLFKNEYDITY